MKARSFLVAVTVATTFNILPASSESLPITASSSAKMVKGLDSNKGGCVNNKRCIIARIEEGRSEIRKRPDYQIPYDLSKQILHVIKKCKVLCSDSQIVQVDALAQQMQNFSESKKVFNLFSSVGFHAKARVRRPFTINAEKIQAARDKNVKLAEKNGHKSFWDQ